MRWNRVVVLCAAGMLAGCGDGNGIGPVVTGADMSKYVAMGTSVTMGVASDGVNATTQQSSWAKLLANDVGVAFTLPLIDLPGCRAPIAAPLSAFRRIDNTPVTSPSGCSPNSTGVLLATQNVAISGATATNAVNTTPATGGSVVARVLAPGQTQITAMRAQDPTFVSVEFGANELLPALSGIVAPGVTVVPLATFTADYQTIIDNVEQTEAQALLVLLPADLSKFPALRTSPEIASQRTAFAQRNVSVNSNCDAGPNLIAIPKLLSALVTGATRAAAGLSAFDLSCADIPGTSDGVLTPADLLALNTLAAQMNTFISARAAENGYATFSLGVLYDTSKDGVPFNLATMLAADAPFGPRISLDGVHPSAVGHAILAAAANAAIVAEYGSIR